MHYFTDEITILSQTAVNAAFTANVNDTITSAAHGLSNGNCVTVANSGGALPAGLSADTYYYIINAATNTFKLSLTSGGTAVDITDTGSGTHTWYQEFESNRIMVTDYRYITIMIDTSGSTTSKLFCFNAISDNAPTFLNPQSATNSYAYQGMIDLDTMSGVNGSDGITISGTDINKSYQINVDSIKWLAFKTKGFTVGTIVIKGEALT